MLNAVNINLVAFGAFRNGDVAGQVFALFVITVAAAEVGVGLAIVLLIYRNRRSIDLDDVDDEGLTCCATMCSSTHAWLIPLDPGGLVLR